MLRASRRHPRIDDRKAATGKPAEIARGDAGAGRQRRRRDRRVQLAGVWVNGKLRWLAPEAAQARTKLGV
jgi:hypothetical protein